MGIHSEHTFPGYHALPTGAPLHELAHDEDHACGSQEEPGIDRTAEGNAWGEPRRGCAIQQKVAEAEQSRANRGKRCQPLEEPGAEQKHCRERVARVTPSQRPQQREQAGGH
ncbi:MAG: hypothetical protein JO202_16765 [Ktedonobacteraceae bacterium]|nr:hypothetical protein [Ktedonobacteraceae bacterium]